MSVKGERQLKEFLNEAKIGTIARHANVMKTYGVCTSDSVTPTIIMGEFTCWVVGLFVCLVVGLSSCWYVD